MLKFSLAILSAMIFTGCAAPTTRTYEVSVKNELNKPVMLWLTKDGGPDEEKWRSPEEIAKLKTLDAVELAGVVIDPGRTATAGPIEGKFASGSEAILRVYVGAETIGDTIDRPRGRGRMDVKLAPGANHFVLKDKNGFPFVEPVTGK